MNGFATGPDVSVAQGTLMPSHWAACAAQDNQFAIIKCGNGNDGSDVNYSTNVLNARNAGLTVGTYHFLYLIGEDPAHPGRSPEDQADAHASKALFQAGDMIAWADVEWPPPEQWGDPRWKIPADPTARANFFADFIVRYTSHYTEVTGVPMGIYSYPFWLQQSGIASLPQAATISAMPFWLAGKLPSMPGSMPAGIAPWTNTDVFQWTGGAAVMPNGAPCDANMCLPSRFPSLITTGGQ
jgi:GH25 family lysozyme M1 (1,4-beta-N-acetylmuramidase)